MRGDSDSLPPSPRRERSLFFSNEKSFRPTTLQLSRAIRRERKSARGKTRDVPFVAREGGGDASWFSSRLFVLCVSFVFSRELEMPKRSVFLVFFELLFSLSRKREKRQCRLEKSLRARAWSGERDATKTRAKKRHGRVAYLFFRTNSICAKGVCACVRAPKSSSRGKRARVWQKTLCGDCFPLKKRKISWLLPLFFSFFLFFGLVFFSFLAKNGGKFFSHSLGSWFFQFGGQHAMDSSFPM